MARILLLTVDTYHAAYTRTKAALEAGGHTVTGTTATTAAALNTAWGAGFDVIATVRVTYNLPAVASWLSGKWSAGVPLLLGGTEQGAPDFSTGHYSKSLGITAQPRTSDMNGFLSTAASSYARIVTPHPIVAGVSTSGTFPVMTGVNWAVADELPSATVGVEVMDAYWAPTDHGITILAHDVGSVLVANAPNVPSGAVAPARAVFIGWIYAGQTDYTANGKKIIHQAASWLAGSGAPSTPVSLTGQPITLTIATPAGSVTAGVAMVSVMGAPFNLSIDTPAGTVVAGNAKTPVGLTGQPFALAVDTPAGTVETSSPRSVDLTGEPFRLTVTAKAGSVSTTAGEKVALGFTLGVTATSKTATVAHATAALGFTFGLTATSTAATAVEAPISLGFTLGLRVTQHRDWGTDPRTGRPGYRVKIVTRTNVGVVELDKAIVTPVTDGVNLVDTWSFRIPRANRKGKKIRPAEHLAQLWRGNIMLTKGPIGPARSDGTWLTYDVRRIDWDLREHRVIGRIPKLQLLRNPGFTQGPDGLAHWKGGWDSESALKAAPTARVVDDPYAIPGTRALEMGAVDKVVTRKVDVESPAVFVPNSATYLSGGEAKIKAVGDDIPEGSVVRIAGFTANDGTGDGLALSLKRAQAAKKTLDGMGKKFVFKLPENLKTPNRNDGTVAGRGYYEPVATNKTEAGRRKNRRVSIAYEGTQKAEGHQQYYYQRLTITQAAALKVPLVVTLAGDMQILRWDGAPKDGWAMRLMVLDIVATKETVETGAVFAPNSASYLSGGEDKIKTIGKKIPDGATINLIGHTADNRVNGDTGTGLDLSLNRAKAVRATLATLDRKFKFKLPKTWTEIPANQRRDDGEVGGRGYFDPVGPNRTDAQQAKNRRVEIYYTAQTVVQEGSESSATMDEFTPRVRWADYQTSVEVPADGKPRTVEARLYPPAGASRWVNVGLWPEEQIGLFNVDQALHIKTWVEHAQDEAMGHADLGIGTRTRLTGVPRTVERRFSERMPVGTQLDWYTAIHNGLDIDCEVTPTTATIVTHYPRQGGTADLMLVHGKPASNVKDYRPLTTSMRDLASSIIMQADGSGAARPEAYASNRKALGGTMLVSVIAAEQETPPAELAQGARVALDQSLHPRPGWEVTIDPAKTTEVLDKIGKGDLVRLQLPDEGIDGLLRVMQRRLDPNTDTLTLTLVEEP